VEGASLRRRERGRVWGRIEYFLHPKPRPYGKGLGSGAFCFFAEAEAVAEDADELAISKESICRSRDLFFDCFVMMSCRWGEKNG